MTGKCNGHINIVVMKQQATFTFSCFFNFV